MRNITQTLFFAFIYNSLGVPIAAGGLYPLFGILLSPMIAAVAMSMSSVSMSGHSDCLSVTACRGIVTVGTVFGSSLIIIADCTVGALDRLCLPLF